MQILSSFGIFGVNRNTPHVVRLRTAWSSLVLLRGSDSFQIASKLFGIAAKITGVLIST